MLTTRYAWRPDGSALEARTRDKLSLSRPALRRKSSSSSTLSSKTMLLTSRSKRASSVLTNSSELTNRAATPRRIGGRAARGGIMRMRLDASVEVDAHARTQTADNCVKIFNARSHCSRQDVARVTERTHARRGVDDRSAVQDHRYWTEGAAHGTVLGHGEAAIRVHPDRSLPCIIRGH